MSDPTIDERGWLCDCCALKLANDDTTGCEAGCGDEHADRLCQFGLERNETPTVGMDGDPEVRGFRCAGCGDDVVSEARALIVVTAR